MSYSQKESIESLMTSECLAGAKEHLSELQPGQRFALEVIREDVLASWIEQSGEGRLLLVVTSLPGKGWIMRVSLSTPQAGFPVVGVMTGQPVPKL